MSKFTPCTTMFIAFASSFKLAIIIGIVNAVVQGRYNYRSGQGIRTIDFSKIEFLRTFEHCFYFFAENYDVSRVHFSEQKRIFIICIMKYQNQMRNSKYITLVDNECSPPPKFENKNMVWPFFWRSSVLLIPYTNCRIEQYPGKTFDGENRK